MHLSTDPKYIGVKQKLPQKSYIASQMKYSNVDLLTFLKMKFTPPPLYFYSYLAFKKCNSISQSKNNIETYPAVL